MSDAIIAPGQRAPDFSLLNQRHQTVTLAQLAGKFTVLYFYPKALTPGCSVQAEGLAAAAEELAALNARVVGISPDPIARLVKFSDKYNLPFDLLADPDHAVAERYGVWGLKKFMGREFLGIRRTTFLIDPDLAVQSVISRVNTKTHAEQVLIALRQLATSTPV